MVRFFEPTLPPPPKDELGVPDMVFMITDTVVIFDHKHRKLTLVANVFLPDHDSLQAAYDGARTAIQRLIGKLEAASCRCKPLQAFAPEASHRRARLRAAIRHRPNTRRWCSPAKEYIKAGDIFQFVPSQRFETDYTGTPAGSLSRPAACESLALHVLPAVSARTSRWWAVRRKCM